ncbi:diguanylate cyclase [Thioalkalivibrio sp. K90mix]|jgi:diguanylate cyclase (GGDEF)-like protein|uniref:GGDEF domain-containing protein n=1 Tax=Thioalkalivibrio sp. (strain K90mix) TaxID=396595 RepID=UPI000195A42F|nr:sensor domain-containing diguanylate cyclase [Thioalkalivibrio sp. K90mix]ADC71630.1 diguanylate cyclase [Thioalkalivibrio sp. K90mix]
MDDIQESTQAGTIAALKAERDQLLTLLKALPDISFVLDAEGRYVKVIGGANEAMYASGKSLEGYTLADALPPAVAEACLTHVQQALRTGEMQTLEYQLCVADVTLLPPSVRDNDHHQAEQWFEGRALPLPSYDHSKPVVLWVAVNITPRKQVEQYWREAAYTDPLTGIANRRALFEQAEHEIERAHRHHRPLSLLVLDIDHFKTINTQYGHAQGDEALRQFTQCCARLLRDTDFMGRIGGEEFVMLLPETDQLGAEQLGARIVEAIPTLDVPGMNNEHRMTVSIGAATRLEGEGFEDLLVRADDALSTAKRSGRNRLRVDQAATR